MKRPNENNQSKNKKQKSSDENQELGIIDSICLRNFMCHDHLKFDFDSHVNFIIGQNGSGKSAILTGIILALGGKSSATGRYPNIKGFIKTGKQKAFLSVTLKNCGYCAYKPDLYGERIIVEREISVDGSSSYKLKSEEGQLISNLKEELNNIINAMDIQIENPVVVLTQETSRNFLMSKQGREEKLYEFFYRGTGIQQLEDNYFLASNAKDDSINELKAKEQAIPGMEKEVDTFRRLIDSSSKIDELKHEQACANVRESQKLLNEKVERKNELEKILSNAVNKSESCKKVYDVECAKLAQYNKEKVECDTERKTQMKILEDLREKQNSCNENLRKAQGMLSRYKREEEKLREDIAILQNSIQENNDRNQNDIYEEKENRKRRIQELEQLNNNAITQQNALDDKRKYLLQEQASTQESKDKIVQEINHFNYQKTALQNTLKQLISAKKDRHVLFGEHTSAVLNEIALRSQEFIEIPKGPIGLYLEVKDPKWNNAVEACLKKGVLCSYCCDNSQDSQLLIQILRKHCGFNIPSVIVSKFLPKMHNVSTQKAQSNFPTVLDMLNIKDPVVANCLIDQLNIENIILVEDIKTAQSIMLDNTPPKNCRSAFLLNCDEILLNPYRHYASNIKPNNLLQTVNESRIRAVEQKCKSLEQKVQDLRQQMGNVITSLKSYPVKLVNLDKEYVNLRSLMKQNCRQIDDLKQYEEPKDVSGMQDELAGFQKELKRKQLDINKCAEEVNKLKAELEELTNRIITQRKLVEKEKAKFNDLLEKIKACMERKEQFGSSKKEYDTKAKNTEVQLNMIKVELKKDKEKFQMIVEAANKFGEPIETDRSVEEITVQITETEKVIRAQSKCDREELLENFKDKFKKLQQAKKDLKIRKQYCIKIDSMLRLRKRKLAEFIKHTQHCLDLAFAVVLKSNGFTGRLDFSKQGCLKLEATRHEKPEAGGQKKTSSLSGGERSFVTVAFLLAVWDRIKTPFRILDEYDVFMDSNFRDLCINLLIKRAEFMKNTQFIFLSPLELPNFKASDNIKVHKMPAPKRMGISNVERMEE